VAAASIVVVEAVASTVEAVEVIIVVEAVEGSTVEVMAEVIIVAAMAAAVLIAAAVMTADADVTTVEIAGIEETGGTGVVIGGETETVEAGVPVATIVAGDIDQFYITLYTGYRRCAGS